MDDQKKGTSKNKEKKKTNKALITLKNDGWWDEEDKRDFQVPNPDRQGWLHIQVRDNPGLPKIQIYLQIFLYI